MAFTCRKGCKKTFESKANRSSHECSFHGGAKQCEICVIEFPNYKSWAHHDQLHKNADNNYLSTSNAEIPKTIREYCNRKVTDEIKIEFAGVISFEDSDLSYGRYVVRQHEEFPIAKAAFECIRQTDVRGMNKTVELFVGAKLHFIRDVHHDFDMQAHPLDYDGTKYQFGHVAAAGNYCKDKKAKARTFVMPNCIPLTQEVNRQVSTFEEEGKNIAVDNWAVIIITLLLLPPKDKIVYLNESNVPVPYRVGKVFLYRNLDGLHIRGRRSVSNYEDEYADENENDPIYDRFRLLEESGVSCDLDKLIISTINGVRNPNYMPAIDDKSILPPFKPFFDLFIDTEMETGVGSIRTRQRKNANENNKKGKSSLKKVPPGKKAAEAATSGSSTSSSSTKSGGTRVDAFTLLMNRK